MLDQLIVALALVVALIELGVAIYWWLRAKAEREVTSALVRVFFRRSLALRPEDVSEICTLLEQRRGSIC